MWTTAEQIKKDCEFVSQLQETWYPQLSSTNFGGLLINVSHSIMSVPLFSKISATAVCMAMRCRQGSEIDWAVCCV